MGGLISLYSFFRAPETFGFAGAMSPSLWFGGRAILDYIENDGRPAGRIYVDVGTEEGAGTVQDVTRLGAGAGAQGLRAGRINGGHGSGGRPSRRGPLGRTPRAGAAVPARAGSAVAATVSPFTSASMSSTSSGLARC